MTPIARLAARLGRYREESRALRALPACEACGHALAARPAGNCATDVQVGGGLGDDYDCECRAPGHLGHITNRLLLQL